MNANIDYLRDKFLILWNKSLFLKEKGSEDRINKKNIYIIVSDS